jgi:hypothetical protein
MRGLFFHFGLKGGVLMLAQWMRSGVLGAAAMHRGETELQREMLTMLCRR